MSDEIKEPLTNEEKKDTKFIEGECVRVILNLDNYCNTENIRYTKGKIGIINRVEKSGDWCKYWLCGCINYFTEHLLEKIEEKKEQGEPELDKLISARKQEEWVMAHAIRDNDKYSELRDKRFKQQIITLVCKKVDEVNIIVPQSIECWIKMYNKMIKQRLEGM